jgi:pyrroline-5-carboxylate reductase
VASDNPASDVIGFLGPGQMAKAMIAGGLRSGTFRIEQVMLCGSSPAACRRHHQAWPGAMTTDSPSELLASCRRVILSVKPPVLRQLFPTLRPLVTEEHLLMSVAAGLGLEQLMEGLGTGRLIRVMPNTPSQVGAGASGVVWGPSVNEHDRHWAVSLLTGLGSFEEVSDEQMHAVTAVSGSGPAYVLMLIEALSDAGLAEGLPRATAHRLAVQTVLGTAELVRQSGEHPALLREQITSPAGTTIAAVEALESAGLRSALWQAVRAAAARSRQLGRSG